MKRALLIVGFLVLIGALAAGGPFGAGPKGGAAISLALGDDWEDYLDATDGSDVLKLSPSAGIFAFYDISPKLTLQAEALVGLYMWELEGEYLAQDITMSPQLFLVEFPILAKYKLPAWRGAFTVMAGPNFFYGIGKIDTMMTLGSDPEVERNVELSQRWAVAVTGGVGYDLPLGPGFLSLDARYTRLLTPLSGEYEDTGDDIEYYLQSFNLYLGYGFRYGRGD